MTPLTPLRNTLRAALRTLRARRAVSGWNRLYRVGAPVRVHRDNGTVVDTWTRSPAQLLGGHTPAIWVVGTPGPYALGSVAPREVEDGEGTELGELDAWDVMVGPDFQRAARAELDS
jgi:hypothetical protein